MTRLLRLVPVACVALMFAALPSQSHAQAQPRNYDCSKAGNANKTVCKTAAKAAPAAPAAPPAPATKVANERHYDCSKAGNANNTVCKGTTTTSVAPAPTASATRPSVARSAAPAAVPGNGNPTAKCRDGSLSYSAHRSGTCSHHGGVASWS
jgi:hypothetical protein